MDALLLSNAAETPTTRRIRLALDGHVFEYRAGQAASLSVDACEPTLYSIASAPSDTAGQGTLEFLVKVDKATRFGSCIADLPLDTRIGVEGPLGSFTLGEIDASTPLLFIAGGTGIAPRRSMIREALFANHTGTMALVYSARTPPEFAFLSEWQALANAHSLTLTLTVTGEVADWEHARGRTGPMHLMELLRPGTLAFVCGPPLMVSDVRSALMALSVPHERIRTESY